MYQTKSRLSPKLRAQAPSDFAGAVMEGLSASPKTLPCRFFYDEKGSRLFEEITALPEYYLTRAETEILQTHASGIASAVAENGVLVEFGSGSSLKTEFLIQHLHPSVAYVAIDVSPSALAEAQRRLEGRFPNLAVYPLVANFAQHVALPEVLKDRPRVGFFPGSTIGNLTRPEAIDLLLVFRSVLGAGTRLIIGVDLKKDHQTLVRAYDDSAGVTAEFNLNILARINRELGGDINLHHFRHEALYNDREGRIEMHLVSTLSQVVCIDGQRFFFHEGESIHTENAYKYTVEDFQTLARKAGWEPHRVWMDEAERFSLHELTA